MSQNKVRKIFICTLIFLPLQYVLVGIIGQHNAEPWPAFILPGFKNVYESERIYKIHQTRFDVYNSSDEKIASLSPHLFFTGIPRSQIAGLTRFFFRDKQDIESFSPEAKAFLFANGKRLTNHDVSRLDIVYRRDFLKSGTGNIEIDSVDASIVGTIQTAN